MKYIKVQWRHENDDDPVEIYSELDDASFEVRKVEIFRNGRTGFVGRVQSSGGTSLGAIPVPALKEIMKDSQFEPSEILAQEFEEVWKKAEGQGKAS